MRQSITVIIVIVCGERERQEMYRYFQSVNVREDRNIF